MALLRLVWVVNGIIGCGLDFSAHACTLIENYVDKQWAAEYKAK